MPLFSIITVSYNVKEKLNHTIKSVLGQTYKNFEYLIVDGASADGTQQLLKKHSQNKQIKIISEPDQGLYDAMNKGVRSSGGKYIIFMNAGDIFASVDVLDKISVLCKDTPGLYYGVAKAVYPNGKIRSNRIFVRKHKNILYDLFEGRMPNHQSMIASRACFKNNLFSLEYSVASDFGWFARCIKRGIKIIPIDLCVACFEIGGRSSRPISANRARAETEKILLREFPVRYRIRQLKMHEYVRSERDKYFAFFLILEQWLSNRQNHRSVEDFLKKEGYQSAAIYGMGVLGNLLYQELKHSAIQINYAIDRSSNDMYFDIPVVSPSDSYSEADVIIITVLSDYDKIQRYIKKKSRIPVLSIEDVVYGAADM